MSSEQLLQLWQSHGYPGAVKLHSIAKSKGLAFTNKQVQEFVAQQETAQVHRKAPKHTETPITASNPRMGFQADLLDMTKYHGSNRGRRWILLTIDIFDRKVSAIPMINKTAETTLQAMKQAFTELGKPLMLTSDSGSEFKGAVDKFLETNRIVHHTTEPLDHNILGIVDRMSQTVKHMISKHMHHQQTTNWIDVLPSLMQNYNDTPHAGVGGLTPNLAEIDTTSARAVAVGRVEKSQQKQRTFAVDDYVRVSKIKGVFGKGYETRWSLKVHRVVKVDGLWYELEDGRKFRADRLMKVKQPSEQAREVEERKEAEVARPAAAPLAPGRRRSPSPPPRRVDNEVSDTGKRDVSRQAKREYRTEQILKHKEGVAQSNVQRTLRERKPNDQVEHALFGRIKW